MPELRKSDLHKIARNLHEVEASPGYNQAVLVDAAAIVSYVSKPPLKLQMSLEQAQSIREMMNELEKMEMVRANQVKAITVVDVTASLKVRFAMTFLDTKDGEQLAIDTFKSWVREARDDDINDEEMAMIVEEELCEIGEGFISIIRSR